VATFKQWLWFSLAFLLAFGTLGVTGRTLYRYVVPIWRRVEVDWTDMQTKAAFLGEQVRKADYVVLGNSVALRGVDAGCFQETVGPAVNLAISSADFASLYGAIGILKRLGAPTHQQTALLIVYQDYFRPWSAERGSSGERFPTTFEGMLHLLRYGAATPLSALDRWKKNLLDATLYRVFPTPVQVTTLREALSGRLVSLDSQPTAFRTSPSGLCGCDEEILPYRYRSWWVENHRCASGSEPSFAVRPAASGYEYDHLNPPSGIPGEYPYTGLADVLTHLSRAFSSTWLVVFPDKFGYADRQAFEEAMRAAADQGGANLLLLTSIDAAPVFYDEHHALPEGMGILTQAILDQLASVHLP
jgi:hypothetical protein